MQFKCKNCGEKIDSFSVMKTLTFRADYEKLDGQYNVVDKEYFGPDGVHNIIYSCSCNPNGTVIKCKEMEDFIRDTDHILEDDIDSVSYGNLVVEK